MELGDCIASANDTTTRTPFLTVKRLRLPQVRAKSKCQAPPGKRDHEVHGYILPHNLVPERLHQEIRCSARLWPRSRKAALLYIPSQALVVLA